MLAAAWPVLLLSLLVGFAAGSEPLEVVATTTIVADIARNVGGRRVHVHSLLAAGVDAHVYQPSPADVSAVAGADVVIVNGLGLEGWMDALIAQSGYRHPVIVASADVEPLSWHASGPAEKALPDPHAWQDVANGIAYVRAIRDGLIAADPAGKDDYEALAALYVRQLHALDLWVRDEVRALPEAARVIVTSHEALQYFGHAYGFEIVGVEGIATGTEPDPAHVADLIGLLRKRAVRAVFVENVANPKVLQRIATEAGVRLGGTLYSDCLGPADGAAATYITMIAANTRAIVDGLRPDQ